MDSTVRTASLAENWTVYLCNMSILLKPAFGGCGQLSGFGRQTSSGGLTSLLLVIYQRRSLYECLRTVQRYTAIC